MTLLFRLLLILAATTFAIPAWSWDPHGHALVGSVADQLLSENARRQVRDILDSLCKAQPSGRTACGRSSESRMDRSSTTATRRIRRPATTSWRLPKSRAMEDYARRNWDNCAHGPGHGCHEAYHFTDVPNSARRLQSLRSSAPTTLTSRAPSPRQSRFWRARSRRPSRSGTRRRPCSWSPTLPATSISRCMSGSVYLDASDPSSIRPLPCPASSRRKRRAAT